MESTPANHSSTPAVSLYGSASGGAGDIAAPSTVAMLAATKPWVRFLSVVVWLGIAIMLILAVCMAIISTQPMPRGVARGVFMIFAAAYGSFAFLYILPAIKLWKYASRIGSLVETRSGTALDAALNEQRGFWKVIGVMTIIMIFLMLAAIMGSAVLASNAGMKG